MLVISQCVPPDQASWLKTVMSQPPLQLRPSSRFSGLKEVMFEHVDCALKGKRNDRYFSLSCWPVCKSWKTLLVPHLGVEC